MILIMEIVIVCDTEMMLVEGAIVGRIGGLQGLLNWGCWHMFYRVLG